MEQPVSAPSTQPEPQPTVVPSEPETQPDPLPRESRDASVEPKAQPDAAPAPAGPAAQSDPLPREPSVAPAEAVAQTNSVPPIPDTVPPTPPVERPRKKRKLEEVGFENFTYFKIRTIVKNLRPSFVQVFQNPNYRETNLAGDILKDIKTVLELSKQLRSDLAALTEPRKASSIPPTKDEPDEVLQENVTNNMKGVPNSDNNIPSEETAGVELKDVPKNLEDGFKGSYVVGGSPVGWNYLVFPGSKPAYYGRSKAEKQACQIEN